MGTIENNGWMPIDTVTQYQNIVTLNESGRGDSQLEVGSIIHNEEPEIWAYTPTPD